MTMANLRRMVTRASGESRPRSLNIASSMADITANAMLERGPAAPTFAKSCLGFTKLYGFMGTGFAHPIMKPEVKESSGTMIVPKMSICGIGLSVSLPE